MRILLYRGKSAWSLVIRKGTRSDYSHVAVEFDDGRVVEAWGTAGVVLRHDKKLPTHSYKVGHTPGTIVDVFAMKDLPSFKFDEQAAQKLALSHVGDGYDWLAIGGMIRRSRKNYDTNDLWICSELTEVIMRKYTGDLECLLVGSPSHHSPQDIYMSPSKLHVQTRVV